MTRRAIVRQVALAACGTAVGAIHVSLLIVCPFRVVCSAGMNPLPVCFCPLLRTDAGSPFTHQIPASPTAEAPTISSPYKSHHLNELRLRGGIGSFGRSVGARPVPAVVSLHPHRSSWSSTVYDLTCTHFMHVQSSYSEKLWVGPDLEEFWIAAASASATQGYAEVLRGTFRKSRFFT